MVQVEYEKLKNKPFPTKKLIKSGIMTSILFLLQINWVLLLSPDVSLFFFNSD